MEFRDYVRLARSRWWVLALATALGGGAAYGVTLLQDEVYVSRGSVIVTPTTTGDVQVALVGENYAQTRVTSYVVIATSDQVASVVAASIGGTAEGLLPRVSVGSPDNTSVLEVSATGPTAQDAQQLVDAWMVATADVIETLEGGEDGKVTVDVLDTARLPVFPSEPQPKTSIAIGMILGLLLAGAFIFVRASLDRRLHTPADVERASGVAVVGVLPFDDGVARRGPTGHTVDFALQEAVRQLRTNLQFMDVDNPPRVIVVTSSAAGDGKSTVSYLLAQAIAESGRDVVLVDADLRRPSIAAKLGLASGAGVTSVLARRAPLEEVLQPYGPTGHLDVLAAGVIPPNPSELVGSRAMRDLLYSFPEETIVLVDSPPLLPVTDAALLTAIADGALVVSRSGKTTVDDLEKAVQSLRRASGRTLGVILDGVPRRGPNKYGYSDAYTYTATATEEELPELLVEPRDGGLEAEFDGVDEGEDGDPHQGSEDASQTGWGGSEVPEEDLATRNR